MPLTGCRTRTVLLDQFDLAWSLAWYHLEGLTTGECLWEPAHPCLHVRRTSDGAWRPDWPETEGYEIGPPSIAWTTWHIGYWWTNAIRAREGAAPLEPGDVTWPGDAERIRATIQALRDRWRAMIEEADEAGLRESRETSWPIPDASFDTILAWLNVELMKNGAEIGAMRFLHAVSRPSRNG